jgi:hypothetical protein
MLVTIDKTLLDCSFQHTGMYLGSLEKWDGVYSHGTNCAFTMALASWRI